jgi:hypothetical protein
LFRHAQEALDSAALSSVGQRSVSGSELWAASREWADWLRSHCAVVGDRVASLRIVDEQDQAVSRRVVGELVLRSSLPELITPGYLNAPEATGTAWWGGWGPGGGQGHRGWTGTRRPVNGGEAKSQRSVVPWSPVTDNSMLPSRKTFCDKFLAMDGALVPAKKD